MPLRWQDRVQSIRAARGRAGVQVLGWVALILVLVVGSLLFGLGALGMERGVLLRGALLGGLLLVAALGGVTIAIARILPSDAGGLHHGASASVDAISAGAEIRLQAMKQPLRIVSEAARTLSERFVPAQEDASIERDELRNLSPRLRELLDTVEPSAAACLRLHAAAEAHGGSMRALTGGAQAVASGSESLTLAVDEAAAHIDQIAAGIQQVAASTGRLSGSMDEAVAAISRIEESIRQIEQDTRASSHLSQGVAQEGARGSAAVRRTIEGMGRIQRGVGQTAKLVRTLGSRSKEIGEILHVIDEIAGQTNLLAINAAIIAAQAGEQGKGFAVVAEEIRDLAERTAASTKEIDTLIKTVQREAGQAVDATEEGLTLVEEGVALGNDAGEALKRILDRAESSSSRARAIVEAIGEQSFGAKKVTQEIENIRTMVKQINLATQAQAGASTDLTRLTREMREHADGVSRASAEGVQRSAGLLESSESIEAAAASLKDALNLQLPVLQSLTSRIRVLSDTRSAWPQRLAEIADATRQLEAGCSALEQALNGSIGTQETA